MDIKLMMYDVIEWKNKLWFSNSEFNGLFCMDKITYEVTFIDFFPNEKIEYTLLHRWIFGCGEKLFFIPFQGRNVHIYDGKKIISIKLQDENDCETLTVGSVYRIHDKVYLFPANVSRDLYVLDMKTCLVEIVSEFKEQLLRYPLYIENKLCAAAYIQISQGFQEGNDIIFGYGYKWILQWNIERKELSLLNKESPDTPVYSLLEFDDKRWMYFSDGKISDIENWNEGKSVTYMIPAVNENDVIFNAFRVNESIYFIFDGARILAKIKGKDQIYIDLNRRFGEICSHGFNMFVNTKNIENSMWIFSPARKGIIEITEDENIRMINPEMSVQERKYFQKRYLSEMSMRFDETMMEQNCELNEFLEYIVDQR